MAKKLKNSITNPPQSVSDSSGDEDGAPVYTPPETESNDSPSSSSYLPATTHLSGFVQGLQDVKLAQDLDQEANKDVPAKKKRGRRNRAKDIVPADIAVNNVTNALQNLGVSDKEADNLEKERTNAKSAKNRREKERKKRRKARKAEEDSKKETDTTSANDKSNYRILKNAGYRGMKHFMGAHCLRLHNDQDMTMAKEMIKWMGEETGYNSSEDQAGAMEQEEEDTGVEVISNYKWLKQYGWGDMKTFMIAHGFKWGDVDDHFAAKELIERLKEDQASEKKEEITKLETTKTKTKIKTKKNTVVGLWEDYFGNETQLANWQRLCIDVGMEEIPTSITQCRKALGKVWVNIFDFLDAKAEGKPVKRYKSEQKLATYTINSGKIYPKKQAKQGGPARVLLAHIFRH
ncbi:hypothetical protein NHQ30_006205 [Ciborinia camelliae]|nr:hypothetical protein NHQ30_006205 [Ciborinia camelliae]